MVQATAAVPVKPAKPVTEIKAAAVVDAPVNATVMEVAVCLTLLDNAIAAVYVADMAGTATPVKESRAVDPPPDGKVDIVEVVAAAPLVGVVRPVTTHDTATLSAVAVVTAMAKLGVV